MSTTQTTEAREALAAWLRQGRAQRKLSLEDVAKVTKIQTRILDKLERGELEGLPADVFVRGFVRSFAKCVGLDEREAVIRYGACQSAEAAASPTARALVESMGLAKKKAEPEVLAPAAAPVAAVPVAAAPVAAAPVAAAPVAAAPVAAARVAPAPVLEASIAAASIAAAPIAAASVVQAPVVEAPVAVEPVVESDEPIIEIAAAPAARETTSKKKKRGGKKNNRRNKKAKQQTELSVAVDSDDEALTNQMVRVDASVVDGSVEEPNLAEGSQRISTGKIQAVLAEGTDVRPVDTRIAAEVDAEVAANLTAEVAANLAAPVVDDVAAMQLAAPIVETASDSTAAIETTSDSTAAVEITSDSTAAVETASDSTAGKWQPTMPPISTTPSVPWRRPSITPTSPAYSIPTLVIDDADPDSADRERDDRSAGKETRLSFLPPILLDREDRSGRQGGLTLAVIILLIAATLTLSYLMRRPSASGDGVTMIDEQGESMGGGNPAGFAGRAGGEALRGEDGSSELLS